MSLLECKFTPAITKYSFSRSSASEGARSRSVVSAKTKRSKVSQKRKQDDVYYKNLSWKEEINKKTADLQIQKEKLIESTLKFKPSTNQNSEKRSEKWLT